MLTSCHHYSNSHILPHSHVLPNYSETNTPGSTRCKPKLRSWRRRNPLRVYPLRVRILLIVLFWCARFILLKVWRIFILLVSIGWLFCWNPHLLGFCHRGAWVMSVGYQSIDQMRSSAAIMCYWARLCEIIMNIMDVVIWWYAGI